MKCIRKIPRLSLALKKRNERALETEAVEQDLLNMIKRRKLSYFGHMTRKESLLQVISTWRKGSCRAQYQERESRGDQDSGDGLTT